MFKDLRGKIKAKHNNDDRTSHTSASSSSRRVRPPPFTAVNDDSSPSAPNIIRSPPPSSPVVSDKDPPTPTTAPSPSPMPLLPPTPSPTAPPFSMTTPPAQQLQMQMMQHSLSLSCQENDALRRELAMLRECVFPPAPANHNACDTAAAAVAIGVRQLGVDDPHNSIHTVHYYKSRISVEDGHCGGQAFTAHIEASSADLLTVLEHQLQLCQDKLYHLEVTVSQLQETSSAAAADDDAAPTPMSNSNGLDWMEQHFQQLRESQFLCQSLQEQLAERQTDHDAFVQQREKDWTEQLALVRRDYASIEANWHQQRLELEESLISMEQQLQTSNQLVTQLQQVNGQLEKSATQQQQENGRLRTDWETQRAALQADVLWHQNEADRWKSKLDQALLESQAELQQTKQLLAEMQTDRDSCAAGWGKWKRDLLTSEEQVERLTGERDAHLQRWQSCAEQLQQVQTLHGQMQEKLHDCESELLEVTRQNLITHRQLQEALQARDAISEPGSASQLLRVQELEGRLKAREKQVDDLDGQLARAQDEVAGLMLQYDNCSAELQTERRLRKQADEEVARGKQVLLEMEAEHKQELNRLLEEYQVQLENHVDEHNSRVKVLVRDFQGKMSEKEMEFQTTFEEALSRVREDEQRLRQEKQEELDQLLGFMKEKDDEMHECENVMRTLENDLQASKALCENLQSDLTHVNTYVLTLENQLSNCQRQLADMLTQQQEHQEQQQQQDSLTALAHSNALMTPLSDLDHIHSTVNNVTDKSLQDYIPLHEYEVLQMHSQDLESQVTQLHSELLQERGKHSLPHLSPSSFASTSSQGQQLEPSTLVVGPIGPRVQLKSSLNITDVPEYEYLKNVLLQYMLGRERGTLTKVLCSVMKFNSSETRNVLHHLHSDSSWFSVFSASSAHNYS